MKLQLFKRMWLRSHGEQPLLTTFWPQDHPRGTTHSLNGTSYMITRYVRSAGHTNSFEVWGRPVKSPMQTITGRARIYPFQPA